MSLNYSYHERTRIDRTPVTRLTDAEVQAVRAKLAADYARHLRNMRVLQRVIAEREAQRAGIDYDCPWEVYTPQPPLALVPRTVAALDASA